MSKPPKLKDVDKLKQPPFETSELRQKIGDFFKESYDDPITGKPHSVGSYIWGVYAFYDYDAEPIYVGQTNEQVSGRVGRHLTNQRTDAVAMSVLDPFEVAEIEIWPLPQFNHIDKEYRKSHKDEFKAALAHLNALEHHVFSRLKSESQFKAILNEKDPPAPTVKIEIPKSKRGRIISDRVLEIRQHPDVRIARRALVVSRLAQVISERSVKFGLRRVLFAQAKRLEWLAKRRFEALGGEKEVEVGPENEEENKAED
jgi:hypothetical protein